MAAQRERVFLAGRLQADRPDAHEGFQFVGQRDGQARVRRRQRVAREARLVVLGRGQRHFLVLAVVAGVVRAHDALQFRELADHVGQEVRFRELRAAFGQQHVVAEAAGDGAGEARDALRALGLRAQLVVVDDVRQQRQARFQRLLLVLLEEELGIRQARAHDALVAADDGGRVVGREVRDDQEARAQLAVRIRQREVLLVRLHRQDQAFLRYGQEHVFELAFVDDGPFDQRRHFIQQRFRHQHLVAAGLGQQLGADRFLAFLGIGDDLAEDLEQFVVGVRMADIEGVAVRQEAVAERAAAGGEAQQRQRHDGLAVQRQQRVHGAHELHGRAVRALVAHHLRDRQLGHRLFQHRLQALGEHAARRRVGVEEAVGLAVLGAFQVADLQVGEAEGGQLLGQRRGRVAVLVEGDGHRQDLLADRLVGRRGAHVGDGDGQAARRGVGGDDAVGGQEITGLQAVRDAAGESGAQFHECLRRQFFGLQFDE